MTQYFEIHPDNPQVRLIRRAAELLKQGGVVVYPTDSSYAIGCRMDDKASLDRIRKIRQLDLDHHFTLLCLDIAQIAHFCRIDNASFRLIRSLTPGPYTFILQATREVPKRLVHEKRKTLGIRIPSHEVTRALVTELGEPVYSTSLIMPGETEALTDPEQIRETLQGRADLILASGSVPSDETTVVDLSGDVPEVVRQGKGSVDFLQ